MLDPPVDGVTPGPVVVSQPGHLRSISTTSLLTQSWSLVLPPNRSMPLYHTAARSQVPAAPVPYHDGVGAGGGGVVPRPAV